VVPGLLLAICCGFCWGIFLAPIRILKAWQWENIWVVWSVFATLVAPWTIAFSTVPHFGEVNREVGAQILLLTSIIGAVSGTAGFLYSYTVPVLGLGLATSLNAGASMAMSLLPSLALHRETILHRSGVFTLFGVCLSVAGTWICGRGGTLREEESNRHKSMAGAKRPQPSFFRCIVLAIVAGGIGSGMNVALAFPNPIFDVARKYGSSGFGATTAFLAPYLAGAFFSNVVYAGRLLRRNNTFPYFFVAGSLRCLLCSILMAALFVLGEYSYAGAVALLGSFGAVITWGLSAAAMILTSSLWDVSQGEWRRQAARAMAFGVGTLIVAVLTLGFAQYFHQIDKLG
jgi:L-rhamnose-H+ transport protein